MNDIIIFILAFCSIVVILFTIGFSWSLILEWREKKAWNKAGRFRCPICGAIIEHKGFFRSYTKWNCHHKAQPNEFGVPYIDLREEADNGGFDFIESLFKKWRIEQ